jgi:hypothetical protein
MIPTAGNDLVLIGLSLTLGVTSGGLCAAATHMRPAPGGGVLTRAGSASPSWCSSRPSAQAVRYAYERGLA